MHRMTPPEAHSYWTKKAKGSGSNFYYSFLFLPRPRREAMYAVYAFCHEVDDTVDHSPPGSDPHQQLAMWRQEVAAIYTGIPSHPVALRLAEPVRRFGIPEDYLQELITGMEMDLTMTRYHTFKELYPYCYRVASMVGLMCLKVFDTRDDRAKTYAINLGLAFQLTNILLDVGVDADRNRISVPLEDLTRFGYPETRLLAKDHSPQFVELMKFQCRRARDFYRKAQAVYDSLARRDRHSLVAAEIMRGVYDRILDRIESLNYHVFGPRISLPPASRLGIAAICWGRDFIRNRLGSFG